MIKANIWLKLLIYTLLLLPLFGGNAPYSYSYVPKFVYKNQVFPVTVLVKHYNPNDPQHFEYDTISLVQPIILKPVKDINKEEAFFTFYFKATKDGKSIEIPTLNIWNLDHSYTLNPTTIPVKKLDISTKNFSNILASNLRVTSTKVDTYDSRHNLITLKLEATEANLEDMHIPNVIDDGVENIKRDGALVTANYYFIVPSSKKSIDFTYYNTIKNRFLDKKVSLVNQKNSFDASELSPKDLSFEKIKKYIIIFFTILFAIAYILSKDYIYLIFFTILTAILIYIYMPKKTICVNEGAPLYILPTTNSNISMQIDKEITTKVLHRYKNFNKIEYKNSITGWIKDDDICKN